MKRTAVDINRPLIALEGGPKSNQWFWLADWHIKCQSVRAQNFPPAHPAYAALWYRPTGRYIDNPDRHYPQGEVWTYTPPAAAGRQVTP